MGAHLVHTAGETLELVEHGGIVQVPEDLLAVTHGVGIVQVAEEDPGDEVTLLAITRDRRRYLVQVQVSGEGAICILLAGAVGWRRLLEQQAGEMSNACCRRGLRSWRHGIRPVFRPLSGQQEPSATGAA